MQYHDNVNQGLIKRSLSFCLLVLACPVVSANPMGGQVVGGRASIQSSGNTTTITQTSRRAIINWQNFSIGSGETTQFKDPNAQSVTLNRVTGGNPSEILGSLASNGQVFIINPSGVLFGENSQVNVSGLLASTANISNANFMQGNYHFTNAPAGSSVINQGTITIANAGLAALVAPRVENSGTIQALLGRVALAAGSAFTVDLYGDNLITFDASSLVNNGEVNNIGRIVANGGIVQLSAANADALLESEINTSGYISATAVGQKDGKIILQGGDNSNVNVGGTLDVSGTDTGQTGGNIHVWGSNVQLQNGLVMNANGNVGGGLIETSGDNVNFGNNFSVSTTALNGLAGTWLIDPTNITVTDSLAGTYSTMLANTNLTISATNDIDFTNSTTSVAWSNNNSFSVLAGNSIDFNTGAGIAINDSGSGTVSLRSDTNNTGAGNVTFTSGPANAVNVPSGTVNIFYNPTSYTSPTNYGTNVNAGTLNAYMLVHNAADLENINTNNTSLSGTYALDGNISSGLGAFTPIGNNTTPFTGTFIGNGFTISNLTINLPGTDDVGLFGETQFATLSNIRLSNVNISGDDAVGSIVGDINGGTLSGAFSSSGTVVGAGAFVGGLFGESGNTTTFASNMSAVMTGGSVSGLDIVGGVFGGIEPGGTYNGTPIWKNYASVSGTGDVGGVVGYVGDNLGNTQLLNYGSISGAQDIGGDIGFLDNGLAVGGLIGSYGNVTGNMNVGGVVGNNNFGSIKQAFATGTISSSGSNPTDIGGLVGYNQGTLSNGLFGGTIQLSTGATDAGGIAGENPGMINTSLSVGSILGSGTNVGAVAGTEDGSTTGLNDVFYSTDNYTGLNAVGDNTSSPGAFGRNSLALTNPATFTPYNGYSFNFASIWTSAGINKNFITLQACGGACTIPVTHASLGPLAKKYVTVNSILNNDTPQPIPTVVYYDSNELMYSIPLSTGGGIYVITVTPLQTTAGAVQQAIDALKSSYGCSSGTIGA